METAFAIAPPPPLVPCYPPYQPPLLLSVPPQGNKRVHIVETEKFEDTFGPRATRTRPKLAGSLTDGYNALQAQAHAAQGEGGRVGVRVV